MTTYKLNKINISPSLSKENPFFPSSSALLLHLRRVRRGIFRFFVSSTSGKTAIAIPFSSVRRVSTTALMMMLRALLSHPPADEIPDRVPTIPISTVQFSPQSLSVPRSLLPPLILLLLPHLAFSIQLDCGQTYISFHRGRYRLYEKSYKFRFYISGDE